MNNRGLIVMLPISRLFAMTLVHDLRSYHDVPLLSTAEMIFTLCSLIALVFYPLVSWWTLDLNGK